MNSDTQPVKSKCSKKKRRASLCVGCGGQIHDQFILRVAPDLEWHASCLKCADCSQFLDETCTCFVREGKTYCKRDYVRLFGTKCAKCNEGFSRNDFVMRALNKIYHIDCFRCVACSRQLIPGDEFALRDDGLFCKLDHDVVERATHNNNNNNNNNNSNNNNNNNNSLLHNGNNSGEDVKNNNFNNNNNETKGGNMTPGNENSNSSTNGNSRNSEGSGSGGGGGRSRGHKEQKTTRVRTVLNEKQLHTLRTCYGANPRPDALMKEQLVEMTGLSPRVIRVWFQNKRCKDKKRSIMMKQLQQQQQEKNDFDPEHEVWLTFKGVPMVASSPVRHEPPPNMQHNPVEVQQYQAPWKALSEFALQSELDQPPFQQLVNSFDVPPGCPPDQCLAQNGMYIMDDFAHAPNSVSSDTTLPGTPSELSSPISQ